MKKIYGLLTILFTFIGCLFVSGCSNSDKTISVCASEIPHAKVLNECVKGLVEKEGYTLEVYTLDWTLQNDAVANGDYDANYFQHVPYLETYNGTTELFAAAKVHYEPLGIYRGKSSGTLESAKTISICNDESNAIRALQLLQAKGVITDLPVNEAGDKLTFDGTEWTSANGVKIVLIAENLLVSTLPDYDFACLPCNTAYTGNVKNEQVAKEDDPAQVALKANILAARKDDYQNDETYKAKIDVLVNALLSKEVSDYFASAFNGTMTCDSSSQIDLR